MLDFRLIPEFGHLTLPKLTEQRVEEWLEQIRPEAVGAHGLSARTVRKLLFVGGAVMKRAAKEYPGWEGNPFAAVDPGTKSDQPEHPWFSDEEVWAIIRAAESEQMKAIILTAWRAGLRLSEIPPLRVKDDVDVDCDEPFIIVNRNYVLGRVNETPKGKRPRRVPMDREGDLVKALAQVLNERGNPGRGELLFPAPGGGMLSPDGITYRYRKARDKAKVRKHGFHTLRHTFCTRLAQSGVHVTKIKAWAGHRSLETTMGYMHHAPDAGDGPIIGTPFRPEQLEPQPELEAVLDRKVGELTVEELAEALARIREEA